jgi:ankyrin repeat protein
LLQLLRGVVDINTKDEKGQTLLHTAASVGPCETVELLLKNRADVHTEDIMGKTLLYKAVRCGCQDMVEILCCKETNINQHTYSGYMSLHLAFHIQFDFIDKLLKERQESSEGLFHTVEAHEQTVQISNEMVKLLFSKGAKVDECDFSKKTVLYIAAADRDIGLVELLLNSGANVNRRSMTERTPFDIALEGGHQECGFLIESVGQLKNMF